MSSNIDIRYEDNPHAPGTGPVYTMYVDGVRAGHLYVSTTYRGRLDSEMAPAFRRRGLGTMLYLHVAREMGAITACIAEQSPDACRLWDSLARRTDVVVETDATGRFRTLRVAA